MDREELLVEMKIGGFAIDKLFLIIQVYYFHVVFTLSTFSYRE